MFDNPPLLGAVYVCVRVLVYEGARMCLNRAMMHSLLYRH